MEPAIWRVQTGVLAMEKSQQASLRPENGMHSIHQGPYQFFGEVISHIPEQNGIEVVCRVGDILNEEPFRINSLRPVFLPDQEAGILSGPEDVFVVDPEVAVGQEGYIGWRSWPQV